MSDDGHTVEPNDEELLAYLVSLGTADVPHSGSDFLHHLQAVQRVLEEAGADPEVSRAGLFHSIYGTQGFQDLTLPLSERDTVRALIGPRAEFAAYCNCVMDRAVFDATVTTALAGGEDFEIRDRVGGPPIALTRRQLLDVAEVHLFDWLEQVARSENGWGYRRAAYRAMAELVGPRAIRAYERMFATEPVGSQA